MNQILYTGDEQVTTRVTENITKQKRVPKGKKVLPINGIIVFYAISIIILGISIISGSVYANTKINQTIEANIKPEITVERNDEDNTVEIKVSHIRKLKSLIYSWNDEEETLIDEINKKEIVQKIDLIGGKNTLNISVIEENGEKQTFAKTFIAGNMPEIALANVDNGIQIKVSCDDEIDYVQYSWDDGEMKKIEVGQETYEGIINAPSGQHMLKVEAISINNIKATKEAPVIGDTEPTVNIKSELVNGKATFVIDVEDDENIKTISIIHNSGEEQIINVNQKKYHHEVIMTEGEINTIIVKATNKNDLSKTRGVKFKNM